MMNVTELFCKIDDFYIEFCPEYKKHLVEQGQQRDRATDMSVSEIMTLIILFHQSYYRNFKRFYTNYVRIHLKKEFPKMLSYSRFIQLLPRVMVPLLAFLNSIKGISTGISFVDSTSIAVCKNKRIGRHKVFKDLATRGKTTMGWFFGFKLHLIVNDRGEIISWSITQGNVDDRKPVPTLAKAIKGKLFGDKGNVSQPLFKDLFEKGTSLITTVRSNMKNRLLPLFDRILLRKRFIIETINDQLKNIAQIEHSRHRSPFNFLINLMAALSAYQLKPKKPRINYNPNQLALIF